MRSLRGAGSVIKWGLQDASVSPQTCCFILKSFSCSPTCFVPHAHINLALQETPEFILPEGWDLENSTPDVLLETSLTVNVLFQKPPLQGHP